MRILSKIGLATVLIGVGLLFSNAVQEPQDIEELVGGPVEVQVESKDYKVYALEVPEKMDFAGEAVPLDNPDIRERLDRELLVNTYWQSNMLIMIKRANKYFPIIEPLLEEYGLPDDYLFSESFFYFLKTVLFAVL